MTPRRASAPPLWFQVLCALACALLLRQLASAGAGVLGADPHAAPPALAFWFIFISIVQAIWKGIEVVGRVTLEILKWSVIQLWHFAKLIASGARELAVYAWRGLQKGWDYLKWTYSNVLKPAWVKVWRFIDRVHTWLERIFAPILKWLRFIRTWILDFYTKFVRPILDLIGITRRVLRVLSALGVEWAKALDRRLGELESKITAPFLWLVQELNKVINLVNTVVTAGGLFQRLAFVKTLQRDYEQAWKLLKSAYDEPLSDLGKRDLKDRNKPRTIVAIEQEVEHYMATGEGPQAEYLDELTGTVLRIARGTK